MLVVGLSGGIASGKTTISNLFAALGVSVIDTDLISRALLEPGNSAYDQIVKKLGNTILLDNGHIDRPQLRKLVFNDKRLKQWLESVLHPVILENCQRQIDQEKKSPYIILVVPLLFETNFTGLVNRTLAVDCDRETQISRLIERDRIDTILAGKIIDQQMSNAERLNRSDDVIVNHGNESQLPEQVNHLHQLYCLMGTSKPA